MGLGFKAGAHGCMHSYNMVISMEQYDTYSGETWGSVTYPFYGNLSTVSDRYVNTERLGREGFSWEQAIVMLSAPICHNISIYLPTKKYPSSLV